MVKPKDLQPVFSFENRKVLFEDRILYVPPHYSDYDSYTFPGWSDKEIFGNDHPVMVEYCSGHGHWIVERATSSPQTNWVAVEKRFDRVQKIWAKVKNLGLSNLLIVCGEAYLATRLYFPKESVSGIFINFPDPWPKEKHAKHRLVHSESVNEIHRVLQKESFVTLATDHLEYTKQFVRIVLENGQFSPTFPDHYTTEWPSYGASWFEELWKTKGRQIYYTQFQAQKSYAAC